LPIALALKIITFEGNDMPAGVWDGEIKLLYAVDKGTFFTADTVDSATSFDVIANVEIGARLNENVNRQDLFLTVQNLSQSVVKASTTVGGTLAPQVNTDRNEELRANFNPPGGGWGNDGDVLEVIASYKVTAGVNTDYSTARSDLFIVTT
jgi:hypothetical protein